MSAFTIFMILIGVFALGLFGYWICSDDDNN